MKPNLKLPAELVNFSPQATKGKDLDDLNINSPPSTVRKSPMNRTPVKESINPIQSQIEKVKQATSNNFVSTLEESKENINTDVYEEAVLITERVQI